MMEATEEPSGSAVPLENGKNKGTDEGVAVNTGKTLEEERAEEEQMDSIALDNSDPDSFQEDPTREANGLKGEHRESKEEEYTQLPETSRLDMEEASLENNMFASKSESVLAEPQLESVSENEVLELESVASLPRIVSKTTIIHNSDESSQDIFERLMRAIKDGSMEKSEVVDQLFNVLVAGNFDLENRFIIEDYTNIDRMLTLLTHCDESLQAEIWSVFVALVRKSNRNLEACSRVGLIMRILDQLPAAPVILTDLLIQLLGLLTTYSITVKETKHFLRSLQAVDNTWPSHAMRLLQVMTEMPQTDNADVFFSFPGKSQAGIIIPPLSKFPYQQGWTFATWFRMDPLNSVTFEKERPYLYCFRTNKGVGYSCQFTGNCLVVNSEKTKGKPISKCIRVGSFRDLIMPQAELTPRKWHHVALAHHYSRWGRSEIKCYLDGQLAETVEMSWVVSTSDHFDRCAIGVCPEGDADSAFCGQMGASYLFAEAVSLKQAHSLFCLGPSYQSYFKHDSESNLPEGYKKHLFDGRLNAALVMAYCPKNCHGQLCLHAPPKTSTGYFVQIPHAVMREGVEVITTHSIHNSLQSVGGIQILLPLFSQLDLPQKDGSPVDVDICSTLLSLISKLLRSSQTSQQQLYQCKGFLIIAHALQKASPSHLTMNVVETVIGMAKFLLTCPAGLLLLKQLFDHILFNPRLWINSAPEVQWQLYCYLSTEFLANSIFPKILRRVPTVIELCHAVKHFYWVVPPKPSSNYQIEPRDPDFPIQTVVEIRKEILLFIRRLIVMTDDGDSSRDEEINTLLNFVSTVNEDDNLYDFTTLIINLLAEFPQFMIPSLDRNKAIGVVFKLLTSPNQLIRLPALKLLGFFLQRSTMKRKMEAVGNLNLFTFITERLLLHSEFLSIATYNVLLEILVERVVPAPSFVLQNPANPDYRFENPMMLKVMANLIQQSKETEELMQVKKQFLLDLVNMCRGVKENRRTILQMSVWQEWLISLTYIYPTTDAEKEIAELVYEVFAILLQHAIRHEYGGWRVWVDTLAIAHSKVSWERYRQQQNGSNTSPAKTNSSNEEAEEGEEKPSSEKPSPIYRTPEFCWSHVHLRLLGDLLSGIEAVLIEWKIPDQPSSVTDACNHNDNQIFVGNAVHVISQLADSVIMASGGLLPLLASATSPNSELEIVDATQQDLPIEQAADILSRFVALADTFVFNSSVSFAELEQEKNMPSGGVLRQSLRLVATSTVRHILAAKVDRPDNNHGRPFDPHSNPKNEAIYAFVKGALDDKSREGILDLDRLLQECDLTRIKGIVYRDMVEENRQAQFLALAVIYLLSVLMVSRYRDILEPPSSPSPFFNSTTNGADADHADNASVGGDQEIPQTPVEHVEMDEALKEGISSINLTQKVPKKDGKEYKAEELSKLGSSQPVTMEPGERRKYLTDKLQKALETTAPLLREIMSDFRSFLQKTLLGTHGQEIMNDTKVLDTLKSKQGSVIELVMLLCSQEWQTSLQKHAGLAFIELVNEGRLMAHATRDHVLRVSNEADFILNRLRADDVTKHAQFETESSEMLQRRRDEEARNDQLIRSGRRRDSLIASKMLDKMITILRSPSGAWSTQDKTPQMFWRLDVWEDDSRRRKRFIPNVYGSRHPEASVLMEAAEGDSEEERLRRMAAALAPGRGQSTELVDESDIDKWAAEVDPPPSSESTAFSTFAKLIAPGVIVPGTLSITATDLYFDADEDHPLYKQQDVKVLRYCESLHGRWNLQEIRAVFLRRHLLQNLALELFLSSRNAIMFAFVDQETVKKVVYQLPRVGVGVKYGLPQSRKTSLMTPKQLFKHSDMSIKWQKREISNFDYLMFLNTVAGRTFNDLSQYPVFPWILTNYTSDSLDLSLASNFRDLSKPIGALSESRRKFFQERYSSWEDETIPAFHYGTHYSTQAFTLNWLMRVEPFSTMFLSMQGSKFDHPDRVFHSMAETWERCQKDSHDVKELIPELFYLPEMFRNDNGFELGKRSDSTKVDDIILPPWASTPEEFILLHRQALESDLVSCQLNSWIDLIFGFKQRGPEAVRASNVFYYLTYDGACDLKSIENQTQQEAFQNQILSFGQTPVQLLTEAHPPRQSIMSMAPMMFRRCDEDLCMLMKFISNSPIVYLAANTYPQLPNPTVLSIANNLVFSLNKWDNSYTYNAPRPLVGKDTPGELEHSPVMGETAHVRESVLRDINLLFTEDEEVDLPLMVDPLLATGNPVVPVSKRHLGDSFDHRLSIKWNNFVSTTDSRFIFACGYPDYSFRVIDSETAKVRQVVYGHGDVVTCIARSETSLFADCYLATGSLDCTVALWHWNGQTAFVAGEYNTPGETPSPRAILTGHDARITALAVSAEHGAVLSGCEDGTILIHTTCGDLLRRIEGKQKVSLILMSRECVILALYGSNHLVTLSTTAKQLHEAHSDEKIESATLTRDGEFVVTGSDNGKISIWRLFPLQKIYTFQPVDAAIRSVAVTSSHRFVLGGLESGAIVVFNVDFNRWHYEYKQRYQPK